MPDVEVDGLPAASSVAAVDLLHVKQGGIDKKAGVSLVLDLLIDAAPGTLDTLNELAAALGDDPNFASTVTAALAAKAADSAVVHNTGAETVAGVKTFSSSPVVPAAAFPQAAVTNLVSDMAAKAPLASPTFTGTVTLPGDPTLSLHAATKQYTDAAVATGAPNPLQRASVLAATIAALPANTRVSNTLTANANGALTVDDVTVVPGDRILVKNEATGANNGIYALVQSGHAGQPWSMTRATDADASAEVVSGMYTLVTGGTVNTNTRWTLTTADPITLNTTALTFALTAALVFPLTSPTTQTTRTSLFRIQPTTAGVAPFGAGVVGTFFNSTWDYVFDIGYNPRRIVATEPSFTFTVESDYEPTPGTHALEAYFEYRSADQATTFRPIFFYINRSTHALTAVYKADTLQFQSISGANFMVAQPGQFTVSQYTGQDGVFRVGAATGRTSAFKMQNNAVDVVSISAASSYLIQWDIGDGATFKNFMYMQTLGDVGVGTFLSIGSFDSKAVITADTEGSAVSAKAIVARGKSGQSGSLVEVQDNAEAIMSRFDKDGYFMTRKTAAPADADIATGEMALWFDSTNGAAKLMVKAKQADGTVKTAAVALA